MATQSIVCPHCESTLKVPSAVGGKKIRCPKCQETFAAPEEEELEEVGVPKTAASAKRAVRKREEDAATEDADEPGPRRPRRKRPDEDERPRRQKTRRARRSPLLLLGLVGGGVAVLMLGGVVIVAVLVLNRGTGSSSLFSPGNLIAGTTTVKAEDLTREFDTLGMKAFQSKYNNKQFIVEGKIQGILEDRTNGAEKVENVFLTGYREGPAGVKVCCLVPQKDYDPRMATVGNVVRIQGRLTAEDDPNYVYLADCRFVGSAPGSSSAGVPGGSTPAAAVTPQPGANPPASGNPAPGVIEVKAEDLEHDFMANFRNPQGGALRKYGTAPLLIDGKVWLAAERGRGEYVVVLAGYVDPGLHVDVMVTCIFKGNDIAEARKLKSGDSVRIAGKLTPQAFNSKALDVEDCRVVTPR